VVRPLHNFLGPKGKKTVSSLTKRALLLVANYDSGVGYAWWLMESFWVKLAEVYHRQYQVILAYPSISTLSSSISQASLLAMEEDFSDMRIAQVLKQCRFLRRNKVCIIYFSDQKTWHWRYVLYRLCGVRFIVIHDHTPGLRPPVRGLKAWLKRLIHQLPWLSADGVIGATEFVRQRCVTNGCVPLSRSYVAPNGLPSLTTPSKGADLHSIFDIPSERKILVMSGRAHRYKGVDFIFRCVSHLRAIGQKNIHFLFIGDGPDLSTFSSLAKEMGISNCCTFAGRRDDVPSLLEGADIAIHPSRGEVGYSLSILEYMRAGLPLVVPDNPSVCAATVHMFSGMIYPDGDVHAASEILQQLANDNALRTKLGSQAKIAVKQYSLEATHIALLDAFTKIVREGVVCPLAEA